MHALRYTHMKTCKERPQEAERQEPEEAERPPTPEPPQGREATEEEKTYTYMEPNYQQKLHALRTQAPAQGDEEFMERLRRASYAYQELERMKHSKLIRNFYRY